MRLTQGLLRLLATAVLAAGFPSAPARAQPAGAGAESVPSVWDLEPLGRHAAELPYLAFADFACGTDGGPPSIGLTGWWDYARCPKEAATGYHEVYFRYDDEREYASFANNLPGEKYGTLVFSHPAIVSALFSDDGFLMGLRVVTDPRTDDATRLRGVSLLTFLVGRIGNAGLICQTLPLAEREQPIGGHYTKERCDRDGGDVRVHIEANYYRRAGEAAFDPALPAARTTGQFWSETRFEEFFTGIIADREARAASWRDFRPAPSAAAARAMDCPGCDLSGVDLKRASLRGANLAGANLANANLHGADLSAANLHGANLAGANLNKVTATGADLGGANLTSIMAYRSRFDGAKADGANFIESLMGRVSFIGADLRGANFTTVEMPEAALGAANLDGATLVNAWLPAARATRARFGGANLRGAVLYGALLANADLHEADLRQSDLSQADLTAADLSRADLRDASLAGAKLAGTTFHQAQLAGAALPAGFRPKP